MHDRSCKSCGHAVPPLTFRCPECGAPYRGVFYAFGARIRVRERPGRLIADVHHTENGEPTGEIDLVQERVDDAPDASGPAAG